MKKFLTITAAFALVLGLSQCRKPNAPPINGLGEKQHIVLSAGNGNDGSKVGVTISGAMLDLTWEGNETITVSGGATGTLTLTSGAGITTATFEGDITKVNNDPLQFALGTVNYMNQSGTIDCVKENVRLEGTLDYMPNGNYNVDMNLPYAILKLDLHNLVSTTGDVTVRLEGEEVAIMKGVTTTANDLFVMIPLPDEDRNTLCTFTGDKGSHNETYKLAPNTYYTAGAEGGESAVLDVNETDKYCDFNDPKMGISGLPIWAKYNVGVNTVTFDC